jgi:hypothetical protein
LSDDLSNLTDVRIIGDSLVMADGAAAVPERLPYSPGPWIRVDGDLW